MCNETIFCLLFSVFGRTINLATSFYHYFLVSHPIFILVSYVIAYVFISIYILRIGRLLTIVDGLERRKEKRVEYGLRTIESSHIIPQTKVK